MAAAASTLAQPKLTQAQPSQKIPVIGFLHPGFPGPGVPTFAALSDGLRDVGYVEGRTIKVEARWGLGKPETLPQLARDLVQLRPSLVVVTARAAIEASIEAARAAGTILPIIATDLESDPVASGYAASLAQPGGNLTGFFLDAPALCGKWLQQLGEIVPNMRKIAVLWDSTTGAYQRDAMAAATKAQSIDSMVMEFRDDSGVEGALEAGLKRQPQAVVQLGSPLTRQAGPRIARILSNHGLPGMSQFRTFPDGGGLISYGPDLYALYRRLGESVSKILRGARPGDLPIERPHKFELVINLKTAKALRVTIPSTLVATADEVIE